MAISGDNFQFGRLRTKNSYYFSRYPHIWGWASWRRAWRYYDLTMKLWPEIQEEGWLLSLFEEPRSVRYWQSIFQSVYENHLDTWDYPWAFACWIQNGLTVLPHCNLITNIGFGRESTHTLESNHFLANIPSQEVTFPLKHPSFIIRNTRADSFTEQTLFSPTLSRRIASKLRWQISRLGRLINFDSK